MASTQCAAVAGSVWESCCASACAARSCGLPPERLSTHLPAPLGSTLAQVLPTWPKRLSMLLSPTGNPLTQAAAADGSLRAQLATRVEAAPFLSAGGNC